MLWILWLVTIWTSQRLIGQLNCHMIKVFAYFVNNQYLWCNSYHGPQLNKYNLSVTKPPPWPIHHCQSYLVSHGPHYLLCNIHCLWWIFKSRCWLWPLLWMFWLVTVWILVTVWTLLRLISQLKSDMMKSFAYFTNNQCMLCNSLWSMAHQVWSPSQLTPVHHHLFLTRNCC